MSRNLLLSRRARIDTKPELEIVADDVRCAHGATVSRLQQDELFYLQSRGIAADQASRLLLRGFCDEVLRELPGDVPAWGALQGWMLSQEPSR
jgi:Fe-S cluster assembly protein SufD